MAEERLQKILARAGLSSRRKAESLISSGRVRVDGQIVTELGTKANPKKSTIEVDGRRIEPEPLCYGILHKPRGMVTTLSDPEGRPTAREILRQVGLRVVPVGRLDFNTSGALLFTNDGDFAQALSHAKGNAAKVYAAKVQKPVDEQVLARWQESIGIDGKKTRPAEVRVLRREGVKTWLQVTLKEGKKHQVRALGDHAGTPVLRLARLSHAGISTDGLPPGSWRLLSIDELKSLKQTFGVPERLRGIVEPGSIERKTAPRKRVRSGLNSKKPHFSTRNTSGSSDGARKPAAGPKAKPATKASTATGRSPSPPQRSSSKRPLRGSSPRR
jgi:23S rRNA pseudouridine2605 synthase